MEALKFSGTIKQKATVNLYSQEHVFLKSLFSYNDRCEHYKVLANKINLAKTDHHKFL